MITMRKLLVVAILLIAGAAIFGAWFYSQYKAVSGFATTVHEEMHSQPAKTVYKQRFCPEFQENVSLTEFTKFHKTYIENTNSKISFGDDKIDVDSLMERHTGGVDGGFASTGYRSGGVDVGIFLKSTNDTYCILGMEFEAY